MFMHEIGKKMRVILSQHSVCNIMQNYNIEKVVIKVEN